MRIDKASRIVTCGCLLAVQAVHAQSQQLPPPRPLAVPVDAAPDTASPAQITELKAPRITCSGDQLTIVANDSTLAAILRQIRSCIAFDIQVPANLANERTFATLGPGPARQVLNDLLDSFGLNYAIESSSDGPPKILAASLTARPIDAPDVKPGSPNPLASNLAMTPARRLWLSNLNPARPDPVVPTVDESERSTPAATPATQSDSTALRPAPTLPDPTSANPHAMSSNEPSQGAADKVTTMGNVGDQVAATPDGSASPSSADATTPNAPPSPLQNQINQMQQLFEQRRKMSTAAAPSPSPQ